MIEKIQQLESDVQSIKERNVRVEADKAWETSSFRVGSIMVITYVVASVVLYSIGVKNFLLSALLPVIGFFLSTQSLPAIKRYWIENVFLKNK